MSPDRPDSVRFPAELRSGYRPIKVLGSGGMGVALLAEDLALKRQVVIKLALRANSEAYAQRFLREAEALARVRHRNVVEVFTAGRTADGPYLVMEHLEGRDLGEVKLGSRALEVMLAIADGLDAVHEAGLVHRDVKPANILLTADERPVLLDFGLVLDPSRTRVTATGNFVGTLGFLPPEVILGGTSSFAADTYAWGATVFYLLEGRRPYPEDHLGAVATGIVKLAPVRFERIPAEGPLAAMLEACLAENPESRPADAAALRALLAAPPVRRTTRAPRVAVDTPQVLARGRARPWGRALAALFVAATIGGLLIRRSGPRKPAATSAPVQAVLGDGEAEEIVARWRARLGEKDAAFGAVRSADSSFWFKSIGSDKWKGKERTWHWRLAAAKADPAVGERLAVVRSKLPWLRDLRREAPLLERLMASPGVSLLRRNELYRLLQEPADVDLYLRSWGAPHAYQAASIRSRLAAVRYLDPDLDLGGELLHRWEIPLDRRFPVLLDPNQRRWEEARRQDGVLAGATGADFVAAHRDLRLSFRAPPEATQARVLFRMASPDPYVVVQVRLNSLRVEVHPNLKRVEASSDSLPWGPASLWDYLVEVTLPREALRSGENQLRLGARNSPSMFTFTGVVCVDEVRVAFD